MAWRSGPPHGDMEGDDAECHALDRNRKAQAFQLPREFGWLGEGLYGLREVPVSRSFVAIAQPGDGRHDAAEIEAIRSHQRAARWRGKLEDHETPAGPQHPEHLAEGGLAVDQIAQTERDHYRIDAGVALGEAGDVAQAKFDVWLALAGQLEHRGRKVDADHPSRRSDERQEVVGELSGAGAQVERRLARAEPRAAGGAAAPGAVAVRTEHAVASVVSG